MNSKINNTKKALQNMLLKVVEVSRYYPSSKTCSQMWLQE